MLSIPFNNAWHKTGLSVDAYKMFAKYMTALLKNYDLVKAKNHEH